MNKLNREKKSGESEIFVSEAGSEVASKAGVQTHPEAGIDPFFGREEGQEPMKKNVRCALRVAALALVLASSAAAQTWFTGTVDEAVAKAKAEKKLVLLDFYSGG